MNHKHPSNKSQHPFTSLNAVVDDIVARLPDEDKTIIIGIKNENEMVKLYGLGVKIRNEYGLWDGNEALLNNCGTTHPDDASMVILERVWQVLKKTL